MAIDRETLTDLFAHTRQLTADGRAPFDIDQQCRLSFFFVDTDVDRLVRLSDHLQNIGYQVMGLLEPGPEDDDQDTLFLRVDRVETHSIDTLHDRNRQLDEIAVQYGVAAYDGMDVGPVDGP